MSFFSIAPGPRKSAALVVDGFESPKNKDCTKVHAWGKILLTLFSISKTGIRTWDDRIGSASADCQPTTEIHVYWLSVKIFKKLEEETKDLSRGRQRGTFTWQAINLQGQFKKHIFKLAWKDETPARPSHRVQATAENNAATILAITSRLWERRKTRARQKERLENQMSLIRKLSVIAGDISIMKTRRLLKV